MPFVRHALWTKYMRIIRTHRYGYEFTDKAIVENYNKSAGNTHRRALVIASYPKRALFTLAPNAIHNAHGDNEQFVIYPNVICYQGALLRTLFNLPPCFIVPFAT
jgi:hypothetical protein